MLILAGVSINAIVGDNGIITNAQEATFMQSIAELQDFFDQYYVKNYDEFDSNLSKVENVKSKKSSWFYYTIDGYVVDDEGHALYLINKESLLADNPKLNIKGGDAGEKHYKDYVSLSDVYGVTSSLKVYYCQNGIASIRGVDKNELDLENMSRSVISNSSPLASLIPHTEGKDLTIQDLRNVNSLTINADDALANLNDFYRLSSLTELTIKSKKNNELDLTGLRDAYRLKYLCFYDCDLNDYSSISGLTELDHLYLYKSCNDEVEKVFTAMSGVDYLKLKYLGIFGFSDNITNPVWWIGGSDGVNSNVSDISSINLLSSNTKLSVTTLLLHGNQITSLPNLTGFSNVTIATLWDNSLINLDGLEKLSSLNYLLAQINSSLTDIKGIENHHFKYINLKSTGITNVDSLKAGTGQALVLSSNSNLIDITNISNFSKVTYLYLAGCSNLNIESVKSIRFVWSKVDKDSRSINESFLTYLETDEEKNLKDRNLTDTSISTLLLNKTEILKLSIYNNPGLGNSIFNNLDEDLQEAILYKLGDKDSSKTNDAYLRYILSTCTGVQYLKIGNVPNLAHLDFVKYMPDLRELDLRDSSIVDLSILDELVTDEAGNKLPDLSVININNAQTDFTKFQNAINSLWKSSITYDTRGKRI